MGVISQIVNFNGILQFIGTVGIPLGITKYVSKYEKENNQENIYFILNFTFSLIFCLSVLFGILIIPASSFISDQIFNTPSLGTYVIISFLSIPFSLFVQTLDAYVRGLKQFNIYVKLSILISIITIVSTLILTYSFGLTGAIYSFLVSSSLTAFFYVYFLRKFKLINFLNLKFNFLFKDERIRNILKLGVSSLIIGVISQFTLLIIRGKIISMFGMETNGLYQSVYGISNNYLSFFYMTLGVYALPILSENDSPIFIGNEINNLFKLSLFYITPVLIIFFSFREEILLLLYSKNFLASGNFFFFNVLGDFFRAISWIFGIWLIPNHRLKAWITFDVIYNINFALISFILMEYSNLQIISIPLAYFIAGSLHLIINFLFIKKSINFKFNPGNIKVFFLSLCALLLILFTSSYNKYTGYIAVVPILGFWLLLAVGKENTGKLISFFKKT